MFYDKFAMIYKAYDYKLVYVFSTCGRPEYFLWLSVFEMDSSSGFLFFFAKYPLFCTSTQSLWLFEQFSDVIRSLLK